MADLDGLLGTEIASAFTTWLFQEVERLKNEEHAAPIQQQIFEQPSQQTPVANPEVPNVEMDRRLPTDNRLFSSALKSATTGSSDSSRRREPGRSDYVPEEGYRTRRNRTPSPEPMNVEESADRSRRHVSRRDNGRRDRSEEDSRGASRRIVKTDGTLKIEVKDARELISRRRRDSKSPDRQQVSRNIGRSAMDVDQQSPNFPPLPILLPLSGTAPEDRPQRIKCPDFPNCKNDPCSYYHPKRVCIHFPNCGKGPACTYIHPPIPCKFQSLCQNPMCNYTHSPELEAAMAPPAPKPSAPPSIMSAGPKSAVICKFHPHCTNSYCPFVHPVEIPCKFGENCTRLGCHFKHPAGHSGAPKSKIFSPVTLSDPPSIHTNIRNNSVCLVPDVLKLAVPISILPSQRPPSQQTWSLISPRPMQSLPP